MKEKTLGAIDRVWLYSAFGYPHTSCGCFEGLAFFIPEVEGLGLVFRDFQDKTVNGLAFSTMADSAAGGRQVDGFHGVSIEYLRSPKFLQADGGWNRVVWLPSTVKERVRDFIPIDLVDKIATENDVETLAQLRDFLQDRTHPIVDRWVSEDESTEDIKTEDITVSSTQLPTIPLHDIPITAGGFKIILKDAKIIARKMIIRKIKED
jgi:acetyl-CoA decarbonylase/synthase complex subunit beta